MPYRFSSGALEQVRRSPVISLFYFLTTLSHLLLQLSGLCVVFCVAHRCINALLPERSRSLSPGAWPPLGRQGSLLHSFEHGGLFGNSAHRILLVVRNNQLFVQTQDLIKLEQSLQPDLCCLAATGLHPTLPFVSYPTAGARLPFSRLHSSSTPCLLCTLVPVKEGISGGTCLILIWSLCSRELSGEPHPHFSLLTYTRSQLTNLFPSQSRHYFEPQKGFGKEFNCRNLVK